MLNQLTENKYTDTSTNPHTQAQTSQRLEERQKKKASWVAGNAKQPRTTCGGQDADEEEADQTERAAPPRLHRRITRLHRRIAGTRRAQASCTPSRRTHPTTDFAAPKRHSNCRHTTAGERRSVETPRWRLRSLHLIKCLLLSHHDG